MPERIGAYAVERELGAGGMGTVYLARSRGGRAVAVKVARSELAADPQFRERFRAEVAAARQVGGFHTAQVVDADPDAEAPWLATAYIPGPTLSALLAAEGPMDETALRQLGAALAEALEAIHGCGLVHRDLKPGNIVMAADGPRVLDFGIARAMESSRLTSTGVAFGTPGFLAPEQALGQETSGAADVFALGAVLVAAAGGHAFGAGTPMGLMYRAVHEPAELAAVPEGVRRVVAACLSKDPAERPTPGELLDTLAPGPVTPPPAAAYSPTITVPQQLLGPVPPEPSAGPVPSGHQNQNQHQHQHLNQYQQPSGSGPSHLAPTAYGYPPPPAWGPGASAAAQWAPAARTAPGEDINFAAVGSEAAVLIDADGILMDQQGRQLHFGWHEIGDVDHAAAGSKCLRVSVVLRDGSVHHTFVTARRASRLREWLADIPLVLDCFR